MVDNSLAASGSYTNFYDYKGKHKGIFAWIFIR